MTRLGVYAAVSTALAGGVVVSAFHQRANFYSACVYLSQSNLCLMILINLILFIYGSLMYGLQRICYGPLRPIEIEQLYEKAWFAVTETCLAMTIFREEVGAWFLVMFVALLTGKVWGWIGDGRVEVLEQQPPANPRLFHIRLSFSLAMSVIYDLWLMSYTINTVIQQARPNMMVMFLFEFAVLTASSIATACRYGISLIEAKVVKQQTQERLTERRREVREQRAEIIREREAALAAQEGETSGAAQDTAPLPSEDDVDEMDIEVPGWEAKGQFVLSLDLMTDFVKLLIYITFFVILLMFYGLPIHIMRDLFMTGRSFAKRLSAFLKYRRATQDMNTKYEDATAEDIEREDTCIICREEMRPWSITNPPEPPAAPGNPPRARPSGSVNERSRPKKLPCGHILHLGCLKSWLERQQACPTCRRPVVDPPAPARTVAPNNGNAAVQAGGAGAGQQNAPANPPAAPRVGAGMRMLNLGPIRLGFGQANIQDIAQGLGAPQQPPQANAAAPVPRVYGLEFGFPRRQQQQQQQPQGSGPVASTGAGTWQEQIQQIEEGIVAEIRSLQTTQQELHLVQLLQHELARLRHLQTGAADPLASNFQMPQVPQVGAPLITRNPSPLSSAVPQVQRHGVHPDTAVIPAGSADLPPGVTIPEGWTLLPLQRLDESTSDIRVSPSGNVSLAGPSTSLGATAPTATTTQTQPHTAISPAIVTSNNNTLAPAALQRPEINSQASSVDSSDTNAILTPLSTTADQPGPSVANTTLQMPVSSSNPTESRNLNSSIPNPPPAVPQWGSSQLFSGPGRSNRTNNIANTDASPDNPGPCDPDPNDNNVNGDQPLTSRVDPAKSAWASEQWSADGDAGEPTQDHKGKGKAASVEDVDDEAEGA